MHTSKTAISKTTPEIVLKSVFNRYDTNHRGYLDLEAWSHVLEDLGIIDEIEQQALFALADVTNKKTIHFKEFLNLIQSNDFEHILSNQEDYLFIIETYKTFLEYDTDGDGEISWNEFYFYLSGHGYSHQYISSYWHYMDINEGGTISFEQFWKGFKHQSEAHKVKILHQQINQQIILFDVIEEESTKKKLSPNPNYVQNDKNNLFREVKKQLKPTKMKKSAFKSRVGKVVNESDSSDDEEGEQKLSLSNINSASLIIHDSYYSDESTLSSISESQSVDGASLDSLDSLDCDDDESEEELSIKGEKKVQNIPKPHIKNGPKVKPHIKNDERKRKEKQILKTAQAKPKQEKEREVKTISKRNKPRLSVIKQIKLENLNKNKAKRNVKNDNKYIKSDHVKVDGSDQKQKQTQKQKTATQKTKQKEKKIVATKERKEEKVEKAENKATQKQIKKKPNIKKLQNKLNNENKNKPKQRIKNDHIPINELHQKEKPKPKPKPVNDKNKKKVQNIPKSHIKNGPTPKPKPHIKNDENKKKEKKVLKTAKDNKSPINTVQKKDKKILKTAKEYKSPIRSVEKKEREETEKQVKKRQSYEDKNKQKQKQKPKPKPKPGNDTNIKKEKKTKLPPKIAKDDNLKSKEEKEEKEKHINKKVQPKAKNENKNKLKQQTKNDNKYIKNDQKQKQKPAKKPKPPPKILKIVKESNAESAARKDNENNLKSKQQTEEKKPTKKPEKQIKKKSNIKKQQNQTKNKPKPKNDEVKINELDKTKKPKPKIAESKENDDKNKKKEHKPVKLKKRQKERIKKDMRMAKRRLSQRLSLKFTNTDSKQTDKKLEPIAEKDAKSHTKNKSKDSKPKKKESKSKLPISSVLLMSSSSEIEVNAAIPSPTPLHKKHKTHSKHTKIKNVKFNKRELKMNAAQSHDSYKRDKHKKQTEARKRKEAKKKKEKSSFGLGFALFSRLRVQNKEIKKEKQEKELKKRRERRKRNNNRNKNKRSSKNKLTVRNKNKRSSRTESNHIRKKSQQINAMSGLIDFRPNQRSHKYIFRHLHEKNNKLIPADSSKWDRDWDKIYKQRAQIAAIKQKKRQDKLKDFKTLQRERKDKIDEVNKAFMNPHYKLPIYAANQANWDRDWDKINRERQESAARKQRKREDKTKDFKTLQKEKLDRINEVNMAFINPHYKLPVYAANQANWDRDWDKIKKERQEIAALKEKKRKDKTKDFKVLQAEKKEKVEEANKAFIDPHYKLPVYAANKSNWDRDWEKINRAREEIRKLKRKQREKKQIEFTLKDEPSLNRQKNKNHGQMQRSQTTDNIDEIRSRSKSKPLALKSTKSVHVTSKPVAIKLKAENEKKEIDRKESEKKESEKDEKKETERKGTEKKENENINTNRARHVQEMKIESEISAEQPNKNKHKKEIKFSVQVTNDENDALQHKKHETKKRNRDRYRSRSVFDQKSAKQLQDNKAKMNSARDNMEDFMINNGFWQIDFFLILVEYDINKPDDLDNLSKRERKEIIKIAKQRGLLSTKVKKFKSYFE